MHPAYVLHMLTTLTTGIYAYLCIHVLTLPINHVKKLLVYHPCLPQSVINFSNISEKERQNLVEA